MEKGGDGSGDRFGVAEAVHGDLAVVGAPGETAGGEARIFECNAAPVTPWDWVTTIKGVDTGGSDKFGSSVAIWADMVVVGAPGHGDAGAFYVFCRNQGGGDSWGLVAKVVLEDGVAGDQFASALTFDDNRIVVGAPLRNGAGATYLFARSGAELFSDGFESGDTSAWSVATD